MSELKELIETLCPDGVEWKTLGEVTEMQRGTSITKQNTSEGFVPVIAGGIKPAYYCDKSNRIGETITIAGSGANAGYVAYWNIPIFVSDAFSIKGKENVSTRYLYHALLNIQQKIYAIKRGAGIPHVHISSIENFEIPLPPLEVQKEIARILDTFTELETELEAELELRLKQYSYYRDKLLTFGDDVERKKLGEIANIVVGGDVPKDRFSKEKTDVFNVPIYSNGVGESALYGFTDKPRISVPSITIAARGTIGYCSLRKEPFFPIIRLVCVIPSEELYVNYLKYFIDTVKFNVPKTGIPQLTAPEVSSIEIPLPPLAEQKRIADILDRFSELTGSLTSGLPAEIAARKKQYEYYREKLLTFQRK